MHYCNSTRAHKIRRPNPHSQELLSHGMAIDMLNEPPIFFQGQAKPWCGKTEPMQLKPEERLQRRGPEDTQGKPSSGLMLFAVLPTAMSVFGALSYILLIEVFKLVPGCLFLPGVLSGFEVLKTTGLYFLLRLSLPGSYFSFQILASSVSTGNNVPLTQVLHKHDREGETVIGVGPTLTVAPRLRNTQLL